MKIFVQSKRDGYWRAGVQHLAKGKTFPDGTFTEEQLNALRDDPEITMVAGEVEDEPKLELESAPGLSDLAKAAGKAIEDGNTIHNGAPTVEAMADILGCSVTAEQRDAAWAEWKAENNV